MFFFSSPLLLWQLINLVVHDELTAWFLLLLGGISK